MDFSIRNYIPEWLKNGIIILLLIGLLSALGDAFRGHPVLFTIGWLLLPLAAYAARSHAFLSLLTLKGINYFRALIVIFSILIAIGLFGSWDDLRDQYGEKYIKGYLVIYNEDIDDYGRPISTPDINTHNPSDRILLWFIELGFLAICIGVPVLTWKAASLSVEAYKTLEE